MNKFKKLTYIWIFFGIFILFFHPMMYYFYVSKVFPKDNSVVGDLARMTYSVDLVEKRNTHVELEKKHIKYNEYLGNNTDFITIGDSFSEGASSGKNPYYQDYIASTYDVSVLNIKLFENNKNYIETVYSLLNSGQLEKLGVKYILIESVQRRSLERFAISNIDTNINNIENFSNQILDNKRNTNINLKKSIVQFDTSLIDIFNSIFSKSDKNEVSVINNLNLNAFVYNMKFKLKGYGKMAPHVYREHLNKDFFSTEASRDLLFYDEDLKYLKLESDDNIKLMNKNFNTLAKALAKRNIKLIFMPAVDKYNLYSPYIISNTYQKSIFFEYLDSLPKDYIFINTKKILSEQLEKGEKDIFYVDDTHWSHKASEVIIKDESFKIIFN